MTFLHEAQKADVITDYRSCWVAGERSLLCLAITVRMKASHDSTTTTTTTITTTANNSVSGSVSGDSSKKPPKFSLNLGVREIDGFITVTSFKYDDEQYR